METGKLEPAEPKTQVDNSVGKEFVDWAEKYWHLKRNYDISAKEDEESCPYDYIKETFAGKINAMVKERML